MAITQITVTRTYKKPDGTASSGTVSFQLTAPLLDTAGNITVSMHQQEVTLTSLGALPALSLYATNDPLTQPTGVTYEVTEVIDLQRRVYSVTIPYNAAGGTVDLTDLVPSTSEVSYTYATAVALTALDVVAARVTELFASITLQTTITATTTLVPFIFIAPFACTVNYAALALGGAGISASDANWWSIEIRRYRAGSPATIATKTTQLSGGTAITTKVPWVFETNTFDADNKVLQAGDIVAIFFTSNSGVSLSLAHVTVGYTPS